MKDVLVKRFAYLKFSKHIDLDNFPNNFAQFLKIWHQLLWLLRMEASSKHFKMCHAIEVDCSLHSEK